MAMVVVKGHKAFRLGNKTKSSHKIMVLTIWVGRKRDVTTSMRQRVGYENIQ